MALDANKLIVQPRSKALRRTLRQFITGAPLTYLWLGVLLVTTCAGHHLTRHQLHYLLMHESTNISHLATDPLHVLLVSLFFIGGHALLPYLVLFTVFLAPAEHWLGGLRWLTVGLSAHVGATYVSEGCLYLAIRYHHAPERLVRVTDVGVSYFLVGVVAVFAYHVALPWRYGYLAVLITTFASLLIFDFDFTAIGHVCAILIGLSFYPMARIRGRAPLDPIELGERIRRVRA